MKISARSEYACRALVELADGYPDYKNKQLKEIASVQSIPEKYLVHILLQLKKQGIIGSTRGANGGYYLAVPPAKISLGEIIRIVDGPLLPLKCTSGKYKNQCDQENNCHFKAIWQEVGLGVAKVVDEISFATILERIKKRRQDSYQI